MHNKRETKYWICVASHDHVKHGVEEGFAQVCHGKNKPLARMKKDDWLVYYSNVETFNTKNKLQSFTAIGKVIDDNIYQYEMSPGFIPFRRNIKFVEDAKVISIHPLIDHLDFIDNKQYWGYKFRYGIIEISKKDFYLIAKQMDILKSK